MQPNQGMMPNMPVNPAMPQAYNNYPQQGQNPAVPAQAMPQQAMPQQGMPPVQAMPGNPAVPNGGMLFITAPAPAPVPTENSGSGNENADPRIYRPRVTKKNKTYRSRIRMLPRGEDFESYPYVCVKLHYIRDLVTGKLLVAKCCQTPRKTPDGTILPGLDKFSCPYCQDVWRRRNAAKEAGADDDTLKKYLQMLPEDVWYGNALIYEDENHSELNGTVKLWEMNKFQYENIQTPVNEYNKREAAIKSGQNYFDQGNAFIPYDPGQGRDYLIVGYWDENKKMGNGRKGAATYKGSGFAGVSTMLATKLEVNPQTGMQEVVFDHDAMHAILQQCIDPTIVYEDTPTPEMARTILANFWQEVNAEIASKQQSAAAGNFGYGAQQTTASPSPYNQTYATQPFPTGAPGYMPQGNIPNVPATAKVQTGLSFGNVPHTPPTPAYAPTPAAMQTPVNPAQQGSIQPAAPQFAQPAAPAAPSFAATAAAPAPTQAAPQFAQPAAPVAPSFAAPAAQAAPQFAQPAAPQGVPMASPAQAAPYKPAAAPAPAPSTPAFNVPSQGAAPQVAVQAAPVQQPQAPVYETDGEEDLPF